MEYTGRYKHKKFFPHISKKDIWIPHEVWFSPDIGLTEKALYGFFLTVFLDEGKFDYPLEEIANEVGMCIRTIKAMIKKLESKGYLLSQIIPRDLKNRKKLIITLPSKEKNEK